MGRRLEGNIGKYTGGGKSSRSLEMWRGESIRGTSFCGHSIVRKAKRLHSDPSGVLGWQLCVFLKKIKFCRCFFHIII